MQGFQITGISQIGEQQVAVIHIGRQHLGRRQPGLRHQPGDLHEGAHIFLVRGGVHQNRGFAAWPGGPEVAAETRVGRGRRQGRDAGVKLAVRDELGADSEAGVGLLISLLIRRAFGAGALRGGGGHVGRSEAG